MSELENSLTDIGWLNQKLVLSKSTKEFGSTSGNVEETSPNRDSHETTSEFQSPTPKRGVATSHKPVLSYANLIIQAIKSTPSHMMTLNEIYHWITDTYPYFKQATSGWKNSVRHNLSLNKCFIKINRPKDDHGKGSYWTFDISYVDEDGHLKSKNKARPLSQGRLSPYTQNFSPGSAFPDTAPTLHSPRTDDLRASKSVEQSPKRETTSSGSAAAIGCPVILLEQHLSNQMNQQMKLQDRKQPFYAQYADPEFLADIDRGNFANVESNAQPAFTTQLGNTSSRPTFYNSNLSDSFKELFKAIFENSDGELLSPECIRNYESLKNSVKLASSTKWDEIDLTRFPDLAERIDDADSSKWQLNHDQALDLAASLNTFYSSFTYLKEPLNVVENSYPFNDTSFQKDPLISTGSISSVALTSSPLPTSTTISSAGLDPQDLDDYEIEDDFNWDSLLSS